jgi:C-terminal processing protease CtpA/Prc
MYLRRVDESVVQGMREALRTYPDVPGWIVDLCGNGGGGYGPELIEQIKSLPHPVAGLIDAGCMSAGETLARDLVSQAQARLFGSRTAGASSAKRTWRFPSGIAEMILPVRSRSGLGGTPIEYHGISPHEEVEVNPEQMRQGVNSSIGRAEQYILRHGHATAVSGN